MNARYYDSSTGRFLSQDSVRGNAQDENTWNLYTYCANDPINYVDPSGQTTITADDLRNGVGAAAAGGAAFGPAGAVVVGGILILGGLISLAHRNTTYSNTLPQPTAKKEIQSPTRKVAVKNSFGRLKYAAKYGIKAYLKLKKMKKGSGLQVHHIVEQRFAEFIEKRPNQMASVVVTKTEHQEFTNAWRIPNPYGKKRGPLSKLKIWNAAKLVYANYPLLKQVAYRTIYK